MRTLKFETVPKPVFDLVQDKLESALQMLAALVLTDEEVLNIRLQEDPELRPDNMRGWASGMKEELLDETWRPQLVEALRNHGFLTNTVPGFPLSVFESPSNHRGMTKGYRRIEEIALAHAEGIGEGPDPDVLEESLRQQLEAEGYAPALIKHMLRNEGFGLVIQASLERIMRPVRAKQAAEEQT